MKSDALKIKKLKHCCKFSRNIILIKNKNRSLQAQAAEWKQKIKRASGFASCDSSEGSATVETVLVLPIFLCAMTVFLMMGQSIVTEGKIQHAVTQTAHICADQKALERTPNVIAAFYSVFERTVDFVQSQQTGAVCRQSSTAK